MRFLRAPDLPLALVFGPGSTSNNDSRSTSSDASSAPIQQDYQFNANHRLAPDSLMFDRRGLLARLDTIIPGFCLQGAASTLQSQMTSPLAAPIMIDPDLPIPDIAPDQNELVASQAIDS